MKQQREDIQKHCKTQKIDLLRIIEDGGVSGSKDIRERPGIRQLLLEAGQGEFDIVIVTRLDRFSRDLYSALWCEKKLLTHEITVTAIQQDTSGLPEEMAKAFRSIMMTFAELDKDMTIKKMENGKSAKFKTRPVGPSAGRVSYGYTMTGPRGNRELVPQAEEQAGLRKMRTLHKAGYGYRRIAQALNGEITLRGKDMTHPTRDGKPWTHMRVSRAMNSKHGQGIISYKGKSKRVRKKQQEQ